jgi:ABC-2 type transport system ATP-binding protein
MTHSLEIHELEKVYKRFRLDRISLNLPEGLILGLIGPNGAGKTTTLKILMNMVKPDSGLVRIFGRDPHRHSKDIKNRVGYVPEEPRFYGDKTVSWYGAWVSGFYRDWDTNLYEQLLTDFAISRTKKMRQLSKGMRVKMALALALSHRPAMMILDEPTAGLDPVIRRDVLERLRDFSKNHGKSLIISSHITDDIARIADLIVFLIDGRVVLSDGKDDLLAKWRRIHYREGALREDLAASLRCRRQQVFGNSGITDDFPALQGQIQDGLNRETIKVENLNLDDILIAHVKGDETCGAS